MTVSPNNPTGAMYSAESLRAVNALCGDRGLFHIHDEAYEYFTYDGAPHVSPGAIDGASGHTISLYSLSKAYGLASWRIGYMVIPEALWDAVNKIQDTLLICPPAVSQHAAIAALQIGRAYTSAYLPELDGLRHLIFAALGDPDVPCDVPPAGGAFYYLVRVHSALEPLVLTERLIRNHRVAVIPGSAFGDTGCSIRISYGALRPESVTEGVGRLVSGLETGVREGEWEVVNGQWLMRGKLPGPVSRTTSATWLLKSYQDRTSLATNDSLIDHRLTIDHCGYQSSGLIRMFL